MLHIAVFINDDHDSENVIFLSYSSCIHPRTTFLLRYKIIAHTFMGNCGQVTNGELKMGVDVLKHVLFEINPCSAFDVELEI